MGVYRVSGSSQGRIHFTRPNCDAAMRLSEHFSRFMGNALGKLPSFFVHRFVGTFIPVDIDRGDWNTDFTVELRPSNEILNMGSTKKEDMLVAQITKAVEESVGLSEMFKSHLRSIDFGIAINGVPGSGMSWVSFRASGHVCRFDEGDLNDLALQTLEKG